MNLADLGDRGATIAKMERGNWLTGPNWLLNEAQWPQQPKLKCTNVADEECKPTQEGILNTPERNLDERGAYWRTMRVTAWMLGFISNCKARRNKLKRKLGPLDHYCENLFGEKSSESNPSKFTIARRTTG